MRLYLRHLRFGWTVLCAIVAVLLLALWARSYWWADFVQVQQPSKTGPGMIPMQPTSGLGSYRGSIVLGYNGFSNLTRPSMWNYERSPSERDESEMTRFGFAHEDTWLADIYVVPFWFVVSVTFIIGTVPSLPLKRFSLRTLLFAMTLVAVVMGTIMYATH
jgi:hypothetical protein